MLTGNPVVVHRRIRLTKIICNFRKKKNRLKYFAHRTPAFRGDKPVLILKNFFVASVASCHMLWYLYLCADAGVVTESYVDAQQEYLRKMKV